MLYNLLNFLCAFIGAVGGVEWELNHEVYNHILVISCLLLRDVQQDERHAKHQCYNEARSKGNECLLTKKLITKKQDCYMYKYTMQV